MCAFSTPFDEVDLTEAETREWICEVGRRLWQARMIEAHAGNISVRLDERRVLATPTFMSKGFMEPSDLVVIDMEGNQLSGRRKMTSEIRMHLTIYRERSDARACVHAHPRHATAFAVTAQPLPNSILPEFEVFVGEAPTAPYETPGTQTFADALIPYLKDYSVILLSNHGAVAFAGSVLEAFWKIEVVESYCELLTIARQLGPLTPISQEKMAEILRMKERLGIPDRRIGAAEAARCDAPMPGRTGAASGAESLSAALIDDIVRAVVERLKKE